MAARSIQYAKKFLDYIRERGFGMDPAVEELRLSLQDLNFNDNIAANFGTGDDAELVFDATNLKLTTSAGGVVLTSADVLTLVSNGVISLNPTGFGYAIEGLPTRYRLEWIAGQRGKPGINADIQSVQESVREIADPDFEIVGLNGTSALCTYYAEGGLTLTTAGGGTDAEIIAPHLDANQSPWTQVTWGTDQSVRWECRIRTAAAITARIIHAGLKLTNTATTATDDDQAFFRYENAVNTGKWQAISSIAGTDTATDSGVTVAINTDYHLAIVIDSSRIAKFYINGVLVKTTTALTAVDLIPYIGVTENSAAAGVVHVRSQAISRAFA